jgi:hypothetical protein
MADYDSNLIKPVDSLKNISGLAPVKHREERKRRQQLQHENNENDETTQDNETVTEEKAGKENDINSDSIGIDYCA